MRRLSYMRSVVDRNIVMQRITVYAIGKSSPDEGWGASWQKHVARLCETELFYNKMFGFLFILKA